MTFIAERLRMIKPSPTLMLSQMAADMKAAGKDVINLTAGEPDFETPEWVCRAAISAIHRGETRYTNVTGTPALKKAVQEKSVMKTVLIMNLMKLLSGWVRSK